MDVRRWMIVLAVLFVITVPGRPMASQTEHDQGSMEEPKRQETRFGGSLAPGRERCQRSGIHPCIRFPEEERDLVSTRQRPTDDGWVSCYLNAWRKA
jgi:hypothetical protein